MGMTLGPLRACSAHALGTCCSASDSAARLYASCSCSPCATRQRAWRARSGARACSVLCCVRRSVGACTRRISSGQHYTHLARCQPHHGLAVCRRQLVVRAVAQQGGKHGEVVPPAAGAQYRHEAPHHGWLLPAVLLVHVDIQAVHDLVDLGGDGARARTHRVCRCPPTCTHARRTTLPPAAACCYMQCRPAVRSNADAATPLLTIAMSCVKLAICSSSCSASCRGCVPCGTRPSMPMLL